MVSYILREWLVTSGMHMLLMSCGVGLAFPSVLAPALKGDNPEIKVTDDQFNSIMGAYGLYGILGHLIFPMTMQKYGRKLTNILFSLTSITGSIIVACAPNVTYLIVGRGVQGLCLTSYYLSCLMAAEYTHPKRRGFYIVIKGVSGGFGELMCHTLGLKILSFRQTALLGIIPAIISILITFKWPESPQYLAYHGRYEECKTALEWLRGTDLEARKELLELIHSQKERRKLNRKDWLERYKEAATSKGFWVPMFIILLTCVSWQFSGFLFLATYVNEIVTMLTKDRNKAYIYTLIMDVLKMVSIVVSSVIVRLVKRRTMFFCSGLIGCVLMVAISALYYMDKTGVISVKWLTPPLFVLYYVVVNVAIAPVSIVIQGEMIPLTYKCVGTLCASTMALITGLVVITYTFDMISVLDIHGTFGIYAVACMLAYLVLVFLLPETKDRTLQDIENEFDGGCMKYDEIEMETLEKSRRNLP